MTRSRSGETSSRRFSQRLNLEIVVAPPGNQAVTECKARLTAYRPGAMRVKRKPSNWGDDQGYVNMKHPTGRWLAIALGVFLFSFQTFVASASIIVDHTCTDLTKVPQNWVETAKSNLHIAYGHTSHGSQVTDGMTWLVEFINNGGLGLSYPSDLFAWNNGGTDGALDLHDYAMGGDVGYYPDWVNNTRDYLGDPDPETGRGTAHPNVNVIIWSWCGQVSGYSEQTMIANYLTPMSILETEYPGIDGPFGWNR
jgi:hypothetical protein